MDAQHMRAAHKEKQQHRDVAVDALLLSLLL